MKHNLHILILASVIYCLIPDFLSAQPAQQTMKYEVHALGMKIGELTVNQQRSKDELTVEAVTNVHFKIVFNYHVKYYQRSIYRDGCLLSSHLQTLKNGEIHSDTWLKKSGSNYILIENGDSTIIHGNIQYSGSLLYFNEPEQTSSMYMEINGEKDNIKQISNHCYVVTDHNKRQTKKYTYKDGILQRSEIKHAIATIYVERDEEL